MIEGSLMKKFGWNAIFLVLLGCADMQPVMTPELWKQDLEQLQRDILKWHPSPFRKRSAGQIDSVFQDAVRRIPTLNNHQVVVEIMKLTALFGDGHTSFYPGEQQFAKFRYLPVRFWVFADGIYPIAASSEYKSCLDKRLVRVGIVGSSSTVPLTFEDDRKTESEILFPAVTAEEYDDKTQWISPRADLGPVPSVSLRRLFSNDINKMHLKEDYWYQPFDSLKVLYFEYNRSVYLEDAAPLYRMFGAILSFLDTQKDYRLIIDLRNNGGGEPGTADSLIQAIRIRPHLLERGKMTALVSRRTYSAAMTTAVRLRKNANAIVIGEHPRGKPNCPSEGRDLVLKNSKALTTVSTEMVSRDPDLGESDYLPLDREILLKYADYKKGIDVVLNDALDGRQRR